MEEYNIINTSGKVLNKKGESGFTRTNISVPVMVKIPEFLHKSKRAEASSDITLRMGQ